MTDKPQKPADQDVTPNPEVDVEEVTEQPAETAGEEDHRDPNFFRGEDADAPADTGKPAQGN